MSGALTSTFNHAVKATAIVAGFVAGGYLGSMLFDPFFFPIIHDPTNPMGQALKAFMTHNFGFVHEWMGLTGDGGLLNTPMAQSVLGDYMPKSFPAALPQGLAVDDLINPM